MVALNVPFVSEAYDRLMAAQSKAMLQGQRSFSPVPDHGANSPAPQDVVARTSPDLTAPITDIRATREALGMTQSALAERLGLDAPRLSAWENGKAFPAYIDLAMRALVALEAIK